MAIIKAVDRGHNLRRLINYIKQPHKTEEVLIGGWNVDPQNAYAEMMATKRMHHKLTGRAYKHFVQSFSAEDGITPLEANQIAAEFVELCPLFRDFEVIYATHVDRDNVHTHIVVNSARLRGERKFSYSKFELEEMKRLSDLVVQVHGFPTEQERQERQETENVTAWDQRLYRVLEAAHEGRAQSWMYDTGIAVQDAILTSHDKETFVQEMSNRGYHVDWGKRYVRYTTPDGHTVRASKIEDTFSLPSVRWLYGDREEEQQQLQEDLQAAMEKETGTAAAESANERPLPIDYDAFDLDLRREADWVAEDTIEDLRYETACDVCRQLRCSQAVDDFEINMACAGYAVRYNYASRQYIFRHPSGVTVTSSELEAEFGLPSISDALDYMIMRPYVPPGYDGIIFALSHIRTLDEKRLRRLTADHASKVPQPDTPGPQNQGGSAPFQANRNRSFVIDMYSSPNSSMCDQELRAAAIVFGQALCGDPDEMDSYLAQRGYTLQRDGQRMCLHTPRGRRIRITRKQPTITGNRKNDPARIGSLAVIDGQYLCDLGKPQTDAGRQRLMDLAVEAVRGAAAPEDVDARLIGKGIHVLYHRSDKSGKTERELISKDASIRLDETLKEMGIEPQYLKKVPTARMENPLETEKEASETESVPVQADKSSDDLRELLRIVSTAAATAADKESFEEELSAAGCKTRWTKNGTLTFILPGGAHIRSAQLEQRYKLPPISAAFGVEKRVPKSGMKFEAAQAVRRVMDKTTDRDEFDAAMKAAGYTVAWLRDNTDAKIIARDGRTTRLSNLEQIFTLPPVREVLSGIQHKAGAAQKGVNQSAEIGADIDGLRNALSRAAADGSANSRDRSFEESCGGPGNRKPEDEPGTGKGRPVGGTTQNTRHRDGQDDRSLAIRIRRAQREKAAADPRTSVAHGRSKQNRRAGHER